MEKSTFGQPCKLLEEPQNLGGQTIARPGTRAAGSRRRPCGGFPLGACVLGGIISYGGLVGAFQGAQAALEMPGRAASSFPTAGVPAGAGVRVEKA